MSASTIESISEFLLHAGTNFQVLDLGRGIDELSAQAFLDIENGTVPAPKPRQQHAWFAIVFWNTQAANQHYIWFLKLPLDEQGLLVTASRNHFLEIIVDALGSSLADDSEKAEKLPDNPYSFVPPQSQMAQCNAKIKAMLSLPLSEGAALAREYAMNPSETDWQSIPIQGIADLAFQLTDSELESSLINNFDQFNPAFQDALMQACEAVPVSDRLQGVFFSKLESGEQVNLAALRGVAATEHQPTLARSVSGLLSHHELDIDSLSVIAARHFTQFDAALTKQFFEAVAKVDERESLDGQLFSGLFADLVQIPSLRSQVLLMLRDENRSPQLAAAIGRLFQQTRSS
ncbi:DUF3549 family protein [Alteromonas sp. ASW11-19]|uniref:DUF3549 family protein n=1 Tax=Alteromonas salexigens TaxID=2982530 RepID=A0ABT2VRR9_9ALTE|nr:DUF3549 family protein [Alteromonas salexigens]MCU7554921.1 DUF3549 family protein [Alteromonas salexigens]